MSIKPICTRRGNPAGIGWAFLLLQPLLLTNLLLWSSSAPSVHAQTIHCELFPNPQQRFGFNVARDGGRHIDDYNVTTLNGHWYLDYFTQERPSQPADMAYAQMIRARDWQTQTITKTKQTIDTITLSNPGTLWILGNEPDRDKQDHQTPAEYAVFYHEVYHYLKEQDPSSRIATAGVVQSTPLRRHYLDLVLAEYEDRYGTTMPVEIWSMHAFILPENYQWGASIPPGMADFADEGMQYTVGDHDNMEIFSANVLAFRQWMADNGYRDTPLIVTEYGILLSDLHGFPYERVSEFMLGSFDYFLNATDESVGYPADGNRLVQAWSWFSLNYPPYDPDTEFGHNGNLLTPEGAQLALGNDYGNYISKLAIEDAIALDLVGLRLEPSFVVTPTVTPGGTIPQATIHSTPVDSAAWPPTFTLQAQVENHGSAAACNIQVEVWYQPPTGPEALIATKQITAVDIDAGADIRFDWQPETLENGLHRFTVRTRVDNAGLGIPFLQPAEVIDLLVTSDPLLEQLYLPLVQR